MTMDNAADTERLLQTVASLSAAPEKMMPQGRALEEACASTDHALLREIDETVLRRRLAFSTKSGDELSLDVAERRISEILAVPSALMQDHHHLLNRKLADPDASAVASLIAAYCASGQPLFVAARLPEGAERAASGGLSSHALHQALSAARISTSLPAALVDGFEAGKSQAIAVLVSAADGVLMEWGARGCEKQLRHIAMTAGASGPQHGVTLWQGGALGENTVVLGHYEGRTIVALCSMDHAMGLFLTWRKLFVAEREVLGGVSTG